MMPIIEYIRDWRVNAKLATLPVFLGIISAYGITVAAVLASISIVGPLMYILFFILGGIGLLYGILSVVWLAALGCIVAHIFFYFVIRPKLKPESIFRSEYFVIGYGLYFVIAPGFAYLTSDILGSASKEHSVIEGRVKNIQTMSALSVYLPSTYVYRHSTSDQRVLAPHATDRCSIECAIILADTNVQTIVLHYQRSNQQDSNQLNRQSYSFTYIDRDGCRGRDGRLLAWALKDCITSEKVPYSPPQGFYADVLRSNNTGLFVTTSEVALRLSYAEGDKVFEIATFRSGMNEVTELLNALRFPFGLARMHSGKDPDVVMFGDDLASRPGVVSPMYGLLRFLEKVSE